MQAVDQKMREKLESFEKSPELREKAITDVRKQYIL